MKKFTHKFAAPLVLMMCLLVGCNNDDDSLQLIDEEEFLTAKIDGIDLFVQGEEGKISCEKYVTHTGSIDVLLRVGAASGESIEFRLSNYIGNNSYSLGSNNFPGSWIKYRQGEGEWLNIKGNSQNLIEILEDDGNYLTGRFSFQGHNGIDLSRKFISDGNFKVKFDL
ncbi:MAG: hypothetical protein RI572_04625 [Salegentibacter sp.]|uniref:hypothetical protein n=1 Tax=Salegentibacter sp. TaxID=1903072 RepID=UPI002870A5C1|nr:hypothetical protein [Salegentibacter sp.]MDR9456677.1 hypothetical protein [Salegentibacter sp.]